MPDVSFHPAALDELGAAYRWYRAREPAVAERFLAEVERAIERICAAPQVGSMYRKSTRRFVCRRFPFVIIYRARVDEILIVAVAHGRRRPNYWRRR